MTPRTSRLSIIVAVLLIAAIVALAATILLRNTAHAAPADTCDPATTEQCCACEPAGAAEPAPLPRLYLPTVQRSMPPGMSAECTPYVPLPTVTPEAPVTGDVVQEGAQ